MSSSLSPCSINSIDTKTTKLNKIEDTEEYPINQSPILYSNNPLYQKMREFILDLCEQGIGAIESNEQIKAKFGVHAPTLCTIYKWRREYRGGKGEKQILDTPEAMAVAQQNQQSGKIAKKDFEKYCTACNREMSSRHYYEFHMLNVHDVLLGGTRQAMELLEKMSSTRKQQLTFRCDSCSGDGSDYDNFEELQQHKIVEHGQQLRIPALHFKNNNKNNNISSPPGKMRAHPKLARSTTIGRDKSLPLPPGGLRRSARIPKPTSAIIHSLALAKDETDFDGEQQRKNRTQILLGLKEKEARKDAQMNDCIRFKRRWGIKKMFDNKIEYIKPKNSKMDKIKDDDFDIPFMRRNKNSITEQKVSQEEEPFVTLLNDGRIEVEETKVKKSKNSQEKHQIISPAALEASDSMLMALASAALMEKNASATAKNSNNNSSLNPPTTIQTSNYSHPSTTTTSNDLRLKSTLIPSLSTVTTTTTSNNNTIKGNFKEKKFLTTKTHKKSKKHVVCNDEGKHVQNNKNNVEQNVSDNVFSKTVKSQQQDLIRQKWNNKMLEFPHDTTSIENNTNIITSSSQYFTIGNEQNQTALFVSQDDSTWFGHSIAAQLRLMPLHIKELAKMRIQQVIFECNSTSFASFQQFAQLQSKLVIPQNSSSINDSLIPTISSEQNGNEQALVLNCDNERIEENNEEVDVVTNVYFIVCFQVYST